MPPNTVKVARPTRWGNPYSVNAYGVNLALLLFENSLRGMWDPGLLQFGLDKLMDETYKRHCDFRKRFACHPMEALPELRGKNLACWCSIHDPCHRNILLRLANALAP